MECFGPSKWHYLIYNVIRPLHYCMVLGLYGAWVEADSKVGLQYYRQKRTVTWTWGGQEQCK